MRYNVSFIILHPTQWNICSKICQLLKVFNDVTNTLFGIYYPTTNLFNPYFRDKFFIKDVLTIF